MTLELRIVLIVASIFTTWMIMRRIRNSKLQIEDSLYWIGFSGLLILFSVFPQIPTFLSKLAGTYTTANFIYIAIIFLLIIKMFFMTLKISQLETRVNGLVQEMAIEINRQRAEVSIGAVQDIQAKPASDMGPDEEVAPQNTGIVNP